MERSVVRQWAAILVVVLAGSIATALVPQTVPILGAIARQFHVSGARLGWIVSFPTLVCAVGALAFGLVVDRVGDVRLLMTGLGLVVLGDAGVSLAPQLQWLYAARLFQGFGYVCITVAGPTFIQRVSSGETRRAAMALWAAHTPIGFAAAVYFAAQLLAAGFSWHWSFFGHAAAAAAVGFAALSLRRIASATRISRSAGTWRVLGAAPVYAVAVGAMSAAMIQVGVMTLLPSLLAEGHGFSGTQSALVIVGAMATNWFGAMLVVATRLRSHPNVALPVAAAAATLFGFLTVSQLDAALPRVLANVLLFCATIGTANSLVWSLLPAAVPSADAAGATAGLITQGSYIGALLGPPTYFWIRHQTATPIGELSAALAVLMVIPLYAHARSRAQPQPAAHRSVRIP